MGPVYHGLVTEVEEQESKAALGQWIGPCLSWIIIEVEEPKEQRVLSLLFVVGWRGVGSPSLPKYVGGMSLRETFLRGSLSSVIPILHWWHNMIISYPS